MLRAVERGASVLMDVLRVGTTRYPLAGARRLDPSVVPNYILKNSFKDQRDERVDLTDVNNAQRTFSSGYFLTHDSSLLLLTSLLTAYLLVHLFLLPFLGQFYSTSSANRFVRHFSLPVYTSPRFSFLSSRFFPFFSPFLPLLTTGPLIFYTMAPSINQNRRS